MFGGLPPRPRRGGTGCDVVSAGLPVILGCGVDLIEVGRIEREMARRAGDPFDDLFSPAELRWCRARPRPAEAYALGFAAKEACVKALGTGLVGRMGWKDIEISWSEHRAVASGVRWHAGSRASVSLRGETAEMAAAIGVSCVHLAVTICRPSRRITPGVISVVAMPAPRSAPGESSPVGITPGVASGSRATLAAAWVVLEGAAPSNRQT